jgi:hypothetical protein
VAGPADSQERRGREFILSLVHPTDISRIEYQVDTPIERLLAKPLWERNASTIQFPFKDEYSRRQKDARTRLPRLLPGNSLEFSREGWVKIASLRPVAPAAKRPVASILDADRMFFDAGRMVGDPINVYASFEIRVNIKEYTLDLYGIKDNGDSTVLYSCRTGLGSPEYPTPRGSYYIVRIFDDHPLWIPPPSDWAYGQSPSHSVYGGHMMPFFVKKQITDSGEEIVTELDNVAPAVKMMDGGMYRIHGTDSPWSIGSSQSHGCVRLLNRAVKQLADTLKMYVGTTTRDRTPNGKYINLARPVRLVLF